MPVKTRIDNSPRRVVVRSEALPSAQRAFPGAKLLRPADRLSPFDRSIIDTAAPDGASDHALLQRTLDDASLFAIAEGRRVRVSTHGQVIRLGTQTVELRNGVDLDLGISPVLHDRPGVLSNTGSIPFLADGIDHFSLRGGEICGPGSWRAYGNIYKSTQYALQAINCRDFEIDTRFVNGQSGALLTNCTRAEVAVEAHEMNGGAVTVRGGSKVTIHRAVGRNLRTFCVFGEKGAANCKVLFAEKFIDLSRINAGNLPYLYSQLRTSHKVALNPVLSLAWSDYGGGATLVTVQYDPTIDTPAIPRLVVGNYIRMRGVVSTGGIGWNDRNLQILEFLGAGGGGYQFIVADPLAWSPGTYVSAGWVGDMANTTSCLGLETVGLTEDTYFWELFNVIARNSGDAACSLTGDDHVLHSLECWDGHLVGLGLLGKRIKVGTVKSYRVGHWNSRSAKYGGDAVLIAPAAGNVPEYCTVFSIDSRDDIDAALRIDPASRLAEFVPGGVCDKSYVIAPSGTPGKWYIFRGPAPEFFGPVSPLEDGFVEPGPNDNEEKVWNDGPNKSGTDFVYYRTHIGDVYPIGPIGCGVVAISYSGSGQRVIDLAGSDRGNTYPSQYAKYAGPPIILNGEYLNWPAVETATVTSAAWSGGTATLDLGSDLSVTAGEVFTVTVSGMTPAAWNGTVEATATDANTITYAIAADPGAATVLGSVSTPRLLLSGTATQAAGGFYGARQAGNATISRIAGTAGRYAMKVQRKKGSTSTAAINVAQSITGDRVAELRGKLPAFKVRMWRGPKFSDNNARPSWEIRWLAVPGALDNDVMPNTAIMLANGSLDRALTETPQDFIITSPVPLPQGAGQTIVKFYCSPVLGSAKSVAVTANGSGYTSTPTVVFSGGGVGATLPTATATVLGGKVTKVTLTSAGSGMTSVPTIAFSGGGGSGAAATAVVHVVDDDGDWFALERLTCAPADSDFAFEREAIEITNLRLAAS